MTNGTSQSGVVPRKYKSGSIIYFENDKSEYIYILKSGRVILTSIKLDTGEEVKEDVRQGEFFGVKSSLGKYPREETAQTVGDTVVLVMALADFERLILRNVNVVRKMLRVFSNQLRRIGKMVRSVLGDSDDINPEVELFRIGEYYYKESQFQRALYAYKKYMEYYPDTQYASHAMKRIKAIDSGSASPDDAGLDIPDADDMPAVPADDGGGLMDDFSMDEPEGSSDMLDFDDSGSSDAGFDSDFGDDFGIESGSADNSVRTPLSDEMDDFLSEAESATEDSFDDFSFDEPGSSGGGGTIFEMNIEAEDMLMNGDYNGAFELFNTIQTHEASNDEERHVIEKAAFEAGRCQMETGKLKEALQLFSEMIKKYPSSEHIKNALFHMGLIFEKVKQVDKAIGYYNKVLNMSPKDSLNSEALNKIKNLQGS